MKAGQMYDDLDEAATKLGDKVSKAAANAGKNIKSGINAAADNAKKVYKKLTHDICDDDKDCTVIKAWKTTDQRGPSNSALVASMKNTLDAAESMLEREYKRVEALDAIIDKDRASHADAMKEAVAKNEKLAQSLETSKTALNKLIKKRDAFNRKVALKSKELYVFLVGASKSIAKIQADTEKCINKANEVPGDIAKIEEEIAKAEKKNKKCQGKLRDQAEAKKDRAKLAEKLDLLEKQSAILSKETQELQDKTDAAEAKNLAENNQAERDSANLAEASASMQDESEQ